MPDRPDHETTDSHGSAVGAPQFSILSNHPAAAGIGRDRLGLARCLAPVYDLLRHAHTPTPITVTLTAPPGGGKTTALRWLESRLHAWNESRPADGAGVPVRVVWFRPARHGRQMRIALLSEVLLGTVDFAMLSVDALRRLLQVFRPLLGAGFARAAALAKLQQGAAVGARGKADFAWVEALLDERDTGPVFDDQLLTPVLTEFQTYVRAGLRGGERLAVFIDDIDDLSRRERDALGRRVLPDLHFDGVVTILAAGASTLDRLPGAERASLCLALPPADESARTDLLIDRIKSIETDSLWSHVPPAERRDVVAAVVDPSDTPAAAVLALNEVSAAARHRAAAAVGAARLQEFRVALRRAAAERLLERHHAWSTLLSHASGQTLFAAWAAALAHVSPEDLPAVGVRLRTAISEPAGAAQPHESANPEESRAIELARSHPQARALGRILADPRLAALVRHGWTAEPPAPESDALAQRIIGEAARRAGESGPPETWHSLNLSGLELHTLAPLAACTNLRSLRARGVTCGDVEPLANLRRLEALDLCDTPVRDIHALARLRALRELSLDRTRVDDLTPLAGLSELQSLTLSGTGVVDLLPLAGLDALERLDLSGTPVHDVRPLAAPLRLRWLDLSGSAVEEVSGLAGAPQLEALRLANTPVAVVSPLARLDTLRTLDLSGTRVADPSPLAALESLTDLDLSATPIRELGDWLPRLIGLRRLNLSLTGVRNVQPLAELNGLEWLGLTGVEVEDESPLRRLRRLRHIER